MPELTDRLADVREETLRYSQLATAQENLKHLFTVPETVDKTETQIVDGKLFQNDGMHSGNEAIDVVDENHIRTIFTFWWGISNARETFEMEIGTKLSEPSIRGQFFEYLIPSEQSLLIKRHPAAFASDSVLG